MAVKKSSNAIIIATIVSFIAMIVINALANILPINGITTGEVSDSYSNLFAPAGYTFAIWGVIYLLLALYTLYQAGLFKGNESMNPELLDRIGFYFTISSIANALWIFSWHYDAILLSVILMLIILVCLIKIAQLINESNLTPREKLFIKVPFSVYFGWITVATIANITTLLVSLGWNGFGIPEQVWTVIVIIVGLVISVLTMLKFKSITYGLVIIWAYIGILVKHISKNGFDGQYKAVIITVAISIVVLVITEIGLIKSLSKD